MTLTLILNSIAHLLVDAVCAATIFGPVAAEADLAVPIIVYNTLAFSTQAVVGLFTDRLRSHHWLASGAMLLIFVGFVVPLAPMARVVLIGLGNSVFHVAAGTTTLKQSAGKAGSLGVFVAPGAIGLAVGTLWAKELGGFLASVLAVCMVGVAALSGRDSEAEPEGKTADPLPGNSLSRVTMLVPAVLLIAVAVRAIGGTVADFPWKTGALMAFVTALAAFAGKTAGGFLCDRFGPGKTALLSLPLAAVAIAFASDYIAPSLLGQFLLNLTMPVTLWLIYKSMPDSPGFAFGLAASALWPGTIIGGLLPLTGTWLDVLVILCFIFGLGAILWAGRKVFKADMTKTEVQE